MKKLPDALIGFVARIVGKKRFGRALVYSAKAINVNLHKSGLLQVGAGTNVYLENGSEQFFIKSILAPLLNGIEKPVLFDVGANIGNYTSALHEQFPAAEIYAFEPVENTFNQLRSNISDKANAFNIGFGSFAGKSVIYNTGEDNASELSTTHKEILHDIFKSDDVVTEIAFDVDTIDSFCHQQGIGSIDFLKIDVEGNELSVLKGASQMLTNEKIKLIQFEINAHNVYARVFLRDYYLLLTDFEFFRLRPDGMVQMGEYRPINEIFTAQNIAAIHRSVVNQLDKRFLFTL